MAAGTAFKVAAIFQAFDKMSGPITRINNKINQFQKNMKVAQSTTKRASGGIGRSIKEITTGIIGASIAFAIWDKAILGTIRRGAQLETTLVQAGAKFGKSAGVVQGTKIFQKLENAALRAGLTTEFSATQSADSLRVLAQAGLDVTQAIATLPLVVDFATASGLDLARATSISADAIGALGGNIRDLAPADLKAKMAEVNDIMVITANTFNTSVEEMFEASTKGGRILTKIVGASGFQFAALIGNIASGGVKAEIAGRGVRAAFLKMTSGVPKVNKALKKIGVSLTDDTGKFKDVITIISELKSGLAGIKDEGKRLALSNIIFGRVGIVQMDLVLSRTEAQLRATTATMAAQRGEVRRIALLVRSTLTGAWIKFTSRMEGLGLILFTRIKPGLKTVMEFMNRTASAIANAGPQLLNFGALIIKITFAVKAWAIAQALLNKIMKANPIFLLISTLFILTTLFPDIAGKVLQFSDAIFFAVIAIKSIQAAMALWAFATSSMTGLLILQKIGLIALNGWQLIVAGSMAIVTAAQWLWNAAVLAFPIFLIIAGIAALVAAIVWLVTHFDEVIEFFKANWFDVLMLLNPFTAFLAILGKIFPNTIGKLLDKVKNMFIGLFEGIKGMFSGIADFFGFGDDDADVELSKSSDFNVDNQGVNDADFTPNSSVIAGAKIGGRIDVNFNNKPDDVDVQQFQSFNDDIELAGSGL